MSTPELLSYEPRVHAATSVPKYAGTHIVGDTVWLSQVTFMPEDDELRAAVKGSRNPDSCPAGGDNLVAQAHAPHQIMGSEPRQHLTVDCAERAEVTGIAVAASFGVCAIKAARAGLEIDAVPDRLLRPSEGDPDIFCPFRYLAGAVIEGTARADVAVDALGPAGNHYRAE